MVILFERKNRAANDEPEGRLKILWMDHHSVVTQDVDCESHEIRDLKCIHDFQENYRLCIIDNRPKEY